MANLEYSLAAMAIAQPDLVKDGTVSSTLFTDAVAKAIVSTIEVGGEAFTAPATLLGALEDRVDAEAVYEVLQLVPESVDFDEVVSVVGQVRRRAASKTYEQRVASAYGRLARGAEPLEIAVELEAAAEDVKRGVITIDATATAIGEELTRRGPKRRWRLFPKEYSQIDDLFPGIGPDGVTPTVGCSGEGEMMLFAAGYKVGKTRQLLNCVDVLLEQDTTSTTIVTLEDNRLTIALKLMAIKFDVPKWAIEQHKSGAAFLGKDGPMVHAKCEAALAWWDMQGDRIRIYDDEIANVHNFNESLALFRADKLRYGMTHAIADYVQAWGGTDYKDAAKQAYAVRAFAAKNRVNFIGLSQLPNEALKWGSSEGMLSTKGAGEWGAAAHVGFEFEVDHAATGPEVCLYLKIARDAPRHKVYTTYNPATGKILAYNDTPVHMSLENVGGSKKGPPRR